MKPPIAIAPTKVNGNSNAKVDWFVNRLIFCAALGGRSDLFSSGFICELSVWRASGYNPAIEETTV